MVQIGHSRIHQKGERTKNKYFLGYYKSKIQGSNLSISGKLQLMIKKSNDYLYQQLFRAIDIDNSKSFKLSKLISTIAKASIQILDKKIFNYDFIIENENKNIILESMVCSFFKFEDFQFQDVFNIFYDSLFGYLIEIRFKLIDPNQYYNSMLEVFNPLKI
ncbi:hypothetical protein ACTFIV_006221 [Dictyostelium citrinum]